MAENANKRQSRDAGDDASATATTRNSGVRPINIRKQRAQNSTVTVMFMTNVKTYERKKNVMGVAESNARVCIIHVAAVELHS